MNHNYLNILKQISYDEYIQWIPLKQNMSVVSLLDSKDLSRIIDGIENDEELFDFCQLSSNYSCFVLIERITSKPICFCILEFETDKKQIIFHGGRLPVYNNIMMVYRGTAIILKALLNLQFDVLTTSNYNRAIRFNTALGFESYRIDGERVWMRLTHESFEKSSIGQRLLFV